MRAARTCVLNRRLIAGAADASGAADALSAADALGAADASSAADALGAADASGAADTLGTVDCKICDKDNISLLLESPSPAWQAVYNRLNKMPELQNQPGRALGVRLGRMEYTYPPLFIIRGGISVLGLRKQMHRFCHFHVPLCVRFEQFLLSSV
jgi:hypothetical protein